MSNNHTYFSTSYGCVFINTAYSCQYLATAVSCTGAYVSNFNVNIEKDYPILSRISKLLSLEFIQSNYIGMYVTQELHFSTMKSLGDKIFNYTYSISESNYEYLVNLQKNGFTDEEIAREFENRFLKNISISTILSNDKLNNKDIFQATIRKVLYHENKDCQGWQDSSDSMDSMGWGI